MSTIRTMEAIMPPGFRFHPRDDELVLDYLLQKLSGRDHSNGGVAMVNVDLNKCEPWELPEESCVDGRNEWYFFSLRDRKYTTGDRTNRATRSGYWKATGKDRAIVADDIATTVGMRKTLVFYRGRAPKGRKTEWVMHEFRLEPRLLQLGRDQHGLGKEDWVLCKVFYKSKTITPRPPSEDQAGMPLSEPDLMASPLTAPFDGSRAAAEQVFCFSSIPAAPFIRPVSLGDLVNIDTPGKESIGTVISSGLELTPHWVQENDLTQMWNSL
ncbi:hypothetical protein QOZ80_8AG0620520 [Eleusine coracana subsp. coracana]|nr:hypothetical protein QOZ80_8AG0620520 [Eleusine coracana subsp. coracana]